MAIQMRQLCIKTDVEERSRYLFLPYCLVSLLGYPR